MDQWYVMDMFRQVHGPYDIKEVKRRVDKGAAVFVARQGMQGWLTPEMTPELQPPEEAPEELLVEAAANLIERSVEELLELCKETIRDGKVNPAEAATLREWTRQNPALTDIWPANVLCRRLSRVFEDGRVDAGEQAELAVLLAQLTADIPPVDGAAERALHLAFDVPEPEVFYHGSRFRLAGRFAHGTLEFCAKEIQVRGGIVQEALDTATDYLIIGALDPQSGGPDPRLGAIEQALKLRNTQGAKNAILSEEYWVGTLG